MHHPTDRKIHTTTFVTPVVEHWLEWEIAQWVHPMKDRSDDPSHHELIKCVRMYTCICMYIHTYIHTYIHIYIHTHIHMTHTYICTHGLHTHIHTHTYTHTHTHIYTHIHMYVNNICLKINGSRELSGVVNC